jgi:hypothetical protein
MPIQPPQETGDQVETIDVAVPRDGLRVEQEDADPEPVAALKARRQKLERRRRTAQQIYVTLMTAGIACLVLLPFLLWMFHSQITQVREKPLWLVACLYLVLPAAMLPGQRSTLRDLDNELEQVDFQIDLFSYEVSKRETRAEKLLRLNDVQLRRYYNLNLSQNRLVSLLGIGCICLGAAIIGITMYVMLWVPANDKSVTAVLGGVGAILTNFVGAIYLNMNKSSSETLAAFHSRLVETHQLMLGSLLASRIDNNAKREDTLASLSLHLVPGKDAGKPAAAKPAARKQDRKRSQAKRQAGDKVADEGGDGGE